MIREEEIKHLEYIAATLRMRLLQVVYHARAGHIGGGLSSINILTALYFHTMKTTPDNPNNPDRDRFIMSKGHCVEALYCTLEAKGFITSELLDSYGSFNSPLAGHPTVEIPGIEVNTGALGHGLSIATGLSIAAKMDKKTYKTYVLMGDGEQGEGSIYEAAMAAGHYKLDNLTAIIDRNGMQISDKTENVMTLEPIHERWNALGWDVKRINGNDMKSIIEALDNIDYQNNKPHLFISETTKGKGISFMENVLKWHHGVPGYAEYLQALSELESVVNNLKTSS